MKHALAGDFDNIKPNGQLCWMLPQIASGSSNQSALFGHSDRRNAVVFPPSGAQLYLYEHQTFTIQHHQIDFSIGAAVTLAHRPHSELL